MAQYIGRGRHKAIAGHRDSTHDSTFQPTGMGNAFEGCSNPARLDGSGLRSASCILIIDTSETGKAGSALAHLLEAYGQNSMYKINSYYPYT